MEGPVAEALRIWSQVVTQGGDPAEAEAEAVRAIAGDPWIALSVASSFRSSRPVRAQADWGLTSSFKVRDPRGAGVVATFARGALVPGIDPAALLEPPRDLALRVADAARSVAEGPARRAVVLGGGVGALALALEVWGLLDIEVVEADARSRALHEVVAPRTRVVSEARGGADLVLASPPYLALAGSLARAGGGIALFLPAASLDDEAGRNWRRSLVSRHRVRALSGPVARSGANEPWWILSAVCGGGPADVLGVPAERVLGDPGVVIRSARGS